MELLGAQSKRCAVRAVLGLGQGLVGGDGKDGNVTGSFFNRSRILYHLKRQTHEINQSGKIAVTIYLRKFFIST